MKHVRLNPDNAIELVRGYSETLEIPDELQIMTVLKVCLSNDALAPNMSKKEMADDRRALKWVESFKKGYNNRPSAREANPMGTVPDPLIGELIKQQMRCDDNKMYEIISSHRLAMSVENIIGLLLEEFLWEKLRPYGWAMAWGGTVSAVDFCRIGDDTQLLQVKNSDNSENSSSKSVRNAVPSIKLWARKKSRNGVYNWDRLGILVDEIGVDRERVSFLGKNTSKESYEWYFSHPDTPFEVLAFADRIADEVKEEVDLSIPIPNSSKVVETAHLVLKGEYYRQIEAGSKTKECRELNQYYCNKFFGGGKRVGKVRFQLGYSTREGSKPPQMEFQVKDILLVNGIDGSEFPAMVEGRMTTYRDLPRGFVPAAYLLLLGKRIV